MYDNWLKRRRIELHLSQADLARRLELHGYSVTSGAISHWENDRYPIPLNDLAARQSLAAALEFTPSELLDFAGYHIPNDIIKSEAAYRAAAIVERMPVEGQKIAIELLRTLERTYQK
jgi:transcriptional regulator with XRE-family HTH domain